MTQRHFALAVEAQRMLVPAGADCIWRQIDVEDLTTVTELQLEAFSNMDMKRPWVCILLSNKTNHYLTWGVVKYTTLVMRQSRTRPRTVTILKSECQPEIVLAPVPYVFEVVRPRVEFTLDDVERLMRDRYKDESWSVEWSLLSYRLCIHAASQSNSPELIKRFLHAERQLAIRRLTWDQMALVLVQYAPMGGYVKPEHGRIIRLLEVDVCDVAGVLEHSKHVDLRAGKLVAAAPLLLPYVLSVIERVHRANLAEHRDVAVDERLDRLYHEWRVSQLPLLPVVKPVVRAKPSLKRPDGVEIEQCLPACMRELWDKAFNPANKQHLKFEERSVFYRFALRMGMSTQDLEDQIRCTKGHDKVYVDRSLVPEIHSTARFIKDKGDELRDDSCGKTMERKTQDGESMCPFHRHQGADWKEAKSRCHTNQTAIVKKASIERAGTTPLSVADNIAKHIDVEMTP